MCAAAVSRGVVLPVRVRVWVSVGPWHSVAAGSATACGRAAGSAAPLGTHAPLTGSLRFRAISTSTAAAAEEEPPRWPVPRDRISAHFSRSSGPGGQNVNKVNTKAEIRFNLEEVCVLVGGGSLLVVRGVSKCTPVIQADWMDDGTKQRMSLMHKSYLTKHGEFVVTSQRHRT